MKVVKVLLASMIILIGVAAFSQSSTVSSNPSNFIFYPGLYGKVIYNENGEITGFDGANLILVEANLHFKEPLKPNQLNVYTFDGRVLFIIPFFGIGADYVLMPTDNILIWAGGTLTYYFLPSPHLSFSILF